MPASALTATDGANYRQWSLSCCEPKMSDLWPQENEREAFQLGLSPVLYCSGTQIVFRCEHLFSFFPFFSFGDGTLSMGRRQCASC